MAWFVFNDDNKYLEQLLILDIIWEYDSIDASDGIDTNKTVFIMFYVRVIWRKKDKKREYTRNRYQSMSEEEKQKLKQCEKNWKPGMT